MRLGVFGGTFDPIHLGHLLIARRTRQIFRLEKVHFVVATSPPHKRMEKLVPFIHRYAMVSLATADAPPFVPSPVELDPPISSFSLHTMEKFSWRRPREEAKPYFIAGGDSLLDVGGWRGSEQLLSSYNFIFVTRPGVSTGDVRSLLPAGVAGRVCDFRGLGPRQLRARIERLETGEPRESTRIFVIDAGAPDISATQIRNLAASGKRIRHLLSPTVYHYIHKLHLYGER